MQDPYRSKALGLVAILLVVAPLALIVGGLVVLRTGILMSDGRAWWLALPSGVWVFVVIPAVSIPVGRWLGRLRREAKSDLRKRAV